MSFARKGILITYHSSHTMAHKRPNNINAGFDHYLGWKWKNHRHYKNLLRCILCSISRLLQLWIDAIMNKFVKTSKRDNFDLKIGITQKVKIKFLQKYLNVLTIQVSNHSYYLKALDIHKNRKVPKKRTLFIWGPTHMGWKWFNNLTEIREILKSIQSELPRHLFVIFEIAK